MPVVLALDGAAGVCAAGMFADDVVIAAETAPVRQGHPSLLPAMVQRLLAGGVRPALVAVTVGPGSFTGIRGALSLAHGLAAGFGCDLVGVGVAEALMAEAIAAHGPDRPVWVAVQARAGHVFLAHGDTIGSHALDALPPPPPALVLTGNAAAAVAAALGPVDGLVLMDQAAPGLRQVALIGRRRRAGSLPPLAAQPIYVDPPAVSPPPA